MKNLKYKPLIFSSIVKPIVSHEKDKYLAIASLDRLRQFLPNVDPNNYDLLPFSTDAYVANHVNLNGAVVDGETAVATAQYFVYKQTNIEHNRERIVGVILTVGFSEFGTNKPLDAEVARKMKGPFNVTVGGVIWRVASQELADFLEDTNDPDSPHYQAVSSSFEMAYDDYDVAVLPMGSRLLEEAEIVASGEMKTELSKSLKSFGGNGRLDDGRCVATLIKSVMPLGIGLTESPAAEVNGLAVPEVSANEETANMKNEDIINKLESIDQNLKTTVTDLTESIKKVGEAASATTASLEKIQEKVEKISQSEKTNVMKNNEIMKITSLKDITDEALASKTIVASSIVDFVNSELETFSVKWDAEKQSKDQAIKANEEKANELAKLNEQLQKDLEVVKANLKKVEDEIAAKARQETFNARMSSFDSVYELTDEDRKVIASQIKDITEDAFADYEKNLAILLKAKNKEAIAAAKKTKETVASTTTEDTTETVDSTVDKAAKTTPTVAATTTPETKTLKEKNSKIWAPESILVDSYKR